MRSVTYGRTRSRNYQSEKVEINLEVLEGWNELDVLDLAAALVHAKLGELKKSGVDAREINKLYRAYYDDEELDIRDLADQVFSL